MVDYAAATGQGQALLHTRFMDGFRLIVQERIATDGVVRISKETGAFVAR